VPSESQPRTWEPAIARRFLTAWTTFVGSWLVAAMLALARVPRLILLPFGVPMLFGIVFSRRYERSLGIPGGNLPSSLRDATTAADAPSVVTYVLHALGLIALVLTPVAYLR
jgi:hypothetical protein